ncbi:myeloid-derived growth factor [Rhincodon typus]|uniref:myeloid-derived growth factor n=1 Tax=Rhincodon typus TaxID=259920 RepID=UPI002030E040|nr:myeloid-derived growth factor [Rhincodon typus]
MSCLPTFFCLSGGSRFENASKRLPDGWMARGYSRQQQGGCAVRRGPLTGAGGAMARAGRALLAVILVCAAGSSGAAELSRTGEFDVRPGGLVHSHSETLGEHVCTFTYASQGGTNERWHMSVGISEDNKLFSCSVWRPQGKSYLFFTQFKAEVTNAKIEFANGFSQAAVEGRNDVPLKESEYIVGENTVTHKDGSFRSELSKLLIVARTRHDEL